MREILFRGKRRDNGKWVYGHYRFVSIEDCGFHHEIWVDYYLNKNDEWEPSSGNKEDWGYFETVEPETIGQYTGVNDSFGVKIFEGDILESSEYDFDDPVLRFVDGAFKVDGMFMLDSEFLRSVTVIGNIHDNPELLEKTR
jgi:hypothetical protein